jgi:hypothetical protein
MTGLESFQHYVDQFSGAWSGIDVRAISIERTNGEFILGARIALTNENTFLHPNVSQTILPHGINARQLNLPFDRLSSVLNDLSTGSIEFGDQRLIFGRIEGQGIRPADEHSFSFEFNRRQKRGSWLRPHIDWPYLAASATGDQLFNVFSQSRWKSKEELEWELRALEQPFGNFDDLVSSLLGLPRTSALEQYGSCFILVIAPISIRFSSCHFVEDNLQLAIEAGQQVDSSNVEIHAIESCVGGPVSRRSIRLPDSNTFVVKFPKSNPSVSHVAAYLCHRGVVIDSVEGHDLRALKLNPRVAACEAIDADLELFKHFLLGKGKDRGADFETAIAFLLHFLGFSVAHYGRVEKYNDGIDIVAFAPGEELVLAVECTLQEPDVKNKLSKLVRRASELAEKLGQGKKVASVLFTALSQERLSKGDVERATLEKIVLLTSEDAETLLSMALRNVGPIEAWRWVDEHIQRDALERLLVGQ